MAACARFSASTIVSSGSMPLKSCVAVRSPAGAGFAAAGRVNIYDGTIVGLEHDLEPLQSALMAIIARPARWRTRSTSTPFARTHRFEQTLGSPRSKAPMLSGPS